jgi:hypothetical protein
MKYLLNKIIKILLLILFLVITGVTIYYVVYILDYYSQKGDLKLNKVKDNKSSSGALTNTQTSSGSFTPDY